MAIHAGRYYRAEVPVQMIGDNRKRMHAAAYNSHGLRRTRFCVWHPGRRPIAHNPGHSFRQSQAWTIKAHITRKFPDAKSKRVSIDVPHAHQTEFDITVTKGVATKTRLDGKYSRETGN
jgi:hypothetical protein